MALSPRDDQFFFFFFSPYRFHFFLKNSENQQFKLVWPYQQLEVWLRLEGCSLTSQTYFFPRLTCEARIDDDETRKGPAETSVRVRETAVL